MALAASQSHDKRRFGGYLAGFFAALTCPCHVPIYALLLSGTTAGSFLTPGNPWTWALFSIVFLLSVVTAMRLLKIRQQKA